MSSQEPTPPLIQIPNESSASIIPSPGTTTVATPTSSSATVPLVLESGEKDDQGHKRPLTSEAWKYYKRQKINGHWKAICIYCNKQLGGETKNGTSHLRDHTRVCPLKSAFDIRQTFLRASKNQEGKTELGHGLFNQEIARKELAYMVTLHELPLSIVDHIGFRRFVAALQPRFKYVSRNTIKKDIMGIYRNEKTRIMKLLENNQSRVAITTDMWTSNNQKRGFMVITAHFIDNSWILQNRIISFQYVPCPHTSEVLARTLLDCLMDWNIDRKLSTITVDNCSTNDAMVNVLLGKFSDDSLWVEGILIHMRCSAHILNIIVKDGLDVIGDGIERVRDSVLFWTATPKREEKFEETAKQLKIVFSKKLFLDCKTRWNSTYLMLDVALYYKDVFSRLKQRDQQYKCSPLEEDWEMAREISSRLILFYEITELFSGNKYPTANILFPKICEIKIALQTWLICGNAVIETMAETMLDKFDKYWSEVHGIMALATVLDPRYKMELVEFYFIEIYGDRTKEEMQKVLRLCYDLIDRYQSKTSQNERSVQISSHAPLVAASSSSMIGNKNFVEKFKTFLTSKGSAPTVKSELDSYLEERVVPFEVEENFDILNWWKVHGARFPVLQMLAKDVYAIPISTVPSESAFSTSGRVISPHRSKLKPNTIQALMCLQDWLKKDLKGSKNDGNFFDIFEELEENDDEGDECEKLFPQLHE